MSVWIPEPLFAGMVSSLPNCTVDVALFDRQFRHSLVFRRAQPPLQDHWFTLGGRLQKDESLRCCAVRQAKDEAGLWLGPDLLIPGGVFEEVHDNSRFGEGVTYHCINICWGYVLDESSQPRLDAQHSEYSWRPVDDAGFHPFLSRKLTAASRAMQVAAT